MLDRELKKGSAELIILSIVEPRARHGYEISKLIETRSAGQLKFHVASLYPLLYRLEERGWLQGRWVEKAGRAPAPLLQPDRRGPPRPHPPARDLEEPSSTRWTSSRESTMPDPPSEWTEHLRARLASLSLSPAREAEIIEELSQHLDQRYEELRSDGASDADARRLAIDELLDRDALANHMRSLRQAHVPPPDHAGSARPDFCS